MAEASTRFPQYVTDGHHIYPWNENYADFLASGKLKECAPPEPPKARKLTPKEQTKMEALRKKALKEAQEAVKLFSKGTESSAESSEDLFGAPPKD